MKYNKFGQPYERLNIFRVRDNKGVKEYCRVKFFQTKNVQVVLLEDEKEGNFTDSSLEEASQTKEESSKEGNEENVTPKIIAITQKGDEIPVEDLESFCNENELDINAVQAILDGKQKTHKKYTFKTIG